MPTKPPRFGRPAGQRPPDHRPPANQRGYDWDWYKLARLYRAKHPVCEQCEAAGRTREAVDVDHVVPFNGLHDPLRLDWDNLQALCRPCHRRKTEVQ